MEFKVAVLDPVGRLAVDFKVGVLDPVGRLAVEFKVGALDPAGRLAVGVMEPETTVPVDVLESTKMSF